MTSAYSVSPDAKGASKVSTSCTRRERTDYLCQVDTELPESPYARGALYEITLADDGTWSAKDRDTGRLGVLTGKAAI